MFLKLQKQNKFYVLFFAVLFSGVLFFGDIQNVNAAGSCRYKVISSGEVFDVSAVSQMACDVVAADAGGTVLQFLDNQMTPTATPVYENKKDVFSVAKISSGDEGKGTDICQGVGITDGTKIFRCLLLGVLGFAGFVLSMANTIFEFCVNPQYWNAIFNNSAIYTSWEIIRDLLNITFIIVLLYSAFIIIFQVDSSGAKSRLLTIVLMALLVNFSFPITRFIIDMSNSLMYTIINTLNFGGTGTGASGAFGKIVNDGGMQAIINPKTIPGFPEIITAIIFVFMIAITILAVGLLLLIRMITLAILLIFSPVAYVAKILPETKNYASKWWTELFSNAIFGPAMLLGIFVATKMMSVQTGFGSFYDEASKQTNSASVAVVSAMAWMMIPIIIIWYVIGQAKGAGVAGASAIMGQAQKTLNGAGKYLSGYNWGKANVDSFMAARKKRSDEMNKNRWGEQLGNKLNTVQDDIHGALPIPGANNANKRNAKKRETANKEDIKNESEKHDGVAIASLVDDAHAAILTPPPAKKDKVAVAGKIKHMMGRKEFDRELENRIKDRTRPLLNPAGPARPIDIPIRPITTGMTPGEIAQIRNDEATNKRNMDRYVQEQKEWFYAQARTAIKNGETAYIN